VSFNLELCSDLDNVFFNKDEMGEVREFLFVEEGIERIVTTKCCWDTEALKQRVIVQQQGLFLGSVLCFIYKNVFAVEPKPEQIIYSPVRPFRIGYRVVDITDAMECYELYLDKLIA
jgi:hypothetical protein